MENQEGYSPTWITDNFPLYKLECQYFDICKYYIPDDCDYIIGCPIRTYLGRLLEDYVTENNLRMQVRSIVQDKSEE